MDILSYVVNNAPLMIAPVILAIFGVISAYVWEFRLHRGGLGFDYIIFAIVVVIGLALGGAI